MDFAVHYSRAAADLLAAGRVAFDRYKVPAWPDLIDTIGTSHPLYVHFPLRVGRGTGDAIDTETGQPADWGKVEQLLARTGTPFVNLHLEATTGDHPGLPPHSADPAHIAHIAESLLRDIASVAARFGPERVILENIPDDGVLVLPAYLPQVIRDVVVASGCGFLLDLSHARLAALQLGIDPRDYIAALPIERTREIHLTGIQLLDDAWVARLRRHSVPDDTIARFAGRPMDHLPLTEEDWAFTAWAMAEIKRGAWGQPRTIALECGGVGPLWEATTDTATLAAQVPRLAQLIAAARR
jgi:uncharacterized protein (UPF0276 family)